MKQAKKHLISALMVSVALGASGPVASAAITATKNTDAVVSFEKNDTATGPVVKPGTPDEQIKPDELPGKETGTTGPLRIEHLPAFNFGRQKISSQTQKYNANWEKFFAVDASGASTGSALDIAHFAQITDERGDGGQWSLKVTSSTFNKVGSPTVKLGATHIELTEAKLYNTNADIAASGSQTSDVLSKLNVETPHTLPTDGSSVEVMAVKPTKTTDGSKSSIVFNTDYEPGAPSNTGVEKNRGVTLVVPGTDVKEDGAAYQATLTWVLEDAV